ncbi:tniQ family protein [Collimonas fungivorans]|uniref:TniQ family protein n=1 Tax=Collimonas fungivorans TaxID=158899 RepID=A0A127P631_9BURK|nr:TniQ family protein [Collimonas fungivorans]AMO93197.1 tniQ family protein [Collimonas fungivorans]
MITLLPLPDELDRSYLGRLMRANGLPSVAAVINLLTQCSNVAKALRRETCHLDHLSSAANMELTQFVQRHTIIPLHRSFTSCLFNVAHGSTQVRSTVRKTGMRSARFGAYLCSDCIRLDLESYGMSYWRRHHQLPGVTMCSKHLQPLRYVNNGEAFLNAPSRFITDSKMVSEEWAALSQQHPYIQQFLVMSLALLERERPFDLNAVRALLRRKAGFRDRRSRARAARPARPLLSDQVLAKFPHDWLCTILPVFIDKVPGVELEKMDDVFSSSGLPFSATPYILACCVLFASADEALLALKKQPERRSLPQSLNFRRPISEATNSAHHYVTPAFEVA